MAIKSEVRNDKPKCARPFPKLMVSETDSIVLFIDRRVGMKVAPIVAWSASWDMSQFTDFDGSITLSNED